MKKVGKRITILVAEDDLEDQQFIREAFQEAHLMNDLRFVSNGQELLDYLRHQGKYASLRSSPRPGLILLDLNMPGKDGREALGEMRSEPELHRIPVVVLTSSEAEADVVNSYDLGINGYISKPTRLDELVRVLTTFGLYWFQIIELPPE